MERDESEPETEPAAAAPPTCARCETVIPAEYNLINGAVTCTECRSDLEREARSSLSFLVLLQAGGLGLLAAATGAGLYYLAIQVMGQPIPALALLTGFFVGLGVRMGADGRGGWPLQLIAVALTYSVVIVTNLPDMLQDESFNPPVVSTTPTIQDTPAPIPSVDATPEAVASTPPPGSGEAESVGIIGSILGLLASIGLVLAAPLGGGENVFTLSLILAGLYVAWGMNRRRKLQIQGPFPVLGPPATPQ
jgi:hypothetical protein